VLQQFWCKMTMVSHLVAVEEVASDVAIGRPAVSEVVAVVRVGVHVPEVHPLAAAVCRQDALISQWRSNDPLVVEAGVLAQERVHVPDVVHRPVGEALPVVGL
jgi:hypothetical protein